MIFVIELSESKKGGGFLSSILNLQEVMGYIGRLIKC